MAALGVRLADEGARVVVVLKAIDQGNAILGGVFVAALMLPHVVAAPIVGNLVDQSRHPFRLIAAAALLFAAGLVTSAYSIARLPPIVSVAALIATGSLGPALSGALSSQLPKVAHGHLVVERAYGIDSLTYNFAGILGPAVAATASAIVGPTRAALVLAGFAALGFFVLITAFQSRQYTQILTQQPRLGLLTGVHFIVANRALKIVTLTSSTAWVGPGAFPILAGLSAVAFHTPASTGLLVSCIAIGGLLGSLAWTLHPARPVKTPLVVAVSSIWIGLALAMSAVASDLSLLVGFYLLAGLGFGPFVGSLFTARNLLSTPEVRAQVFSIGAGLKTTAAAAGAAAIGVLSSVPIPLLYLICGTATVMSGLVGLLAIQGRPNPPSQETS